MSCRSPVAGGGDGVTADNGFRSDRVRGDARLEPQNVTFPATVFLSCEHTLMHEEKSYG